MNSIAWTAAGAAAWTLLEYLIHDRLGHRSPLHNPFGIEHMAHHATTSYFAPAWKKALAAMIVISGTGAALAPLMGRQAAFAFATGLTGMYALYEIIHRRTHTHAPRGRYGRFLRRHHFYHHFHDPRANFGVTSPFWDLVFGTYARPGVIRVPQKHAMSWLFDPKTGAVNLLFADHYDVGQGLVQARKDEFVSRL